MNPKPVGYRTHKIEFLMPHHAHTEYPNKHNHKGSVQHRFFVQLSYARHTAAKTPLKELSELVHYAEAYKIQNHVYSKGHCRTNSDLSKVTIYASQKDLKRIQQLIFELRHYIGVVTSRSQDGQYVFMNVSDVQDYVVD